MDVWGWSSPVGLAVFFVAIGATAALLGWGLFGLSKAVERFMSLPIDKR